MRINKPTMEWTTFLDNNLNDRAEEKFRQLPRFYKSHDGVRRFTNIDDALDSVSQADWQIIAGLLISKDYALSGHKLYSCLFNICKKQAEEELEEEYEANVQSGKDEAEAVADMRYQRQRDDKLMGE